MDRKFVEDLIAKRDELQAKVDRVEALVARWKALEGSGNNGKPSMTLRQIKEALDG